MEFSLQFKNKYRTMIANSFSLGELKVLSKTLDVDFEEIGGDSKTVKVLELIEYMRRRGKLDALVRESISLRPEINWSELGVEVQSFIIESKREPDEVSDSPPTSSTPDREVRSLLSKPQPPLQSLGPTKNRWALLVGINKFNDPSYSTLQNCIKDVVALESILTANGYTCRVLRDDANSDDLIPTKNNIEAELERIAQNAKRDDLIWVHFSTHGTNNNGDPMLIAKDTRAPKLTAQGVAIEYIIKTLKSSESKRHVLILDACHVGVGLRGELDEDQKKFRNNVNERAQGLAILAASAAEQPAQEASEYGVFTGFLLQGLKGKAIRPNFNDITVNSLSEYILNEMRKWYVLKGRQAQDPTSSVKGLGDMILAELNPSSATTPSPAPTSSQPDNTTVRGSQPIERKPATLDVNLRQKLKGVLLRCGEFKSDASLAALFVTRPLNDFVSNVPQANSVGSRVDLLISELLPLYSNDQPVLILFLEALVSQYPQANDLHGDLTKVIAEINDTQN